MISSAAEYSGRGAIEAPAQKVPVDLASTATKSTTQGLWLRPSNAISSPWSRDRGLGSVYDFIKSLSWKGHEAQSGVQTYDPKRGRCLLLLRGLTTTLLDECQEGDQHGQIKVQTPHGRLTPRFTGLQTRSPDLALVLTSGPWRTLLVSAPRQPHLPPAPEAPSCRQLPPKGVLAGAVTDVASQPTERPRAPGVAANHDIDIGAGGTARPRQERRASRPMKIPTGYRTRAPSRRRRSVNCTPADAISRVGGVQYLARRRTSCQVRGPRRQPHGIAGAPGLAIPRSLVRRFRCPC